MKTALLGDICDIEMGQAPEGDSYNQQGQGVPLIAGAGDFGELYPSPKKSTIRPSKLCRKGDIVVCIRATIGDTNWADREYCLGRGVAGLRPHEGKLDSLFLWYALQVSAVHLAKHARGSTFLQVSRDALLTLPVPLFPLAEQRRIAAILDKADGVRRKRQQALALTDELLRATFLDMFGDPVTNPKGWEVAPLGSLVRDTRLGISRGSKEISPELPYRYVKMDAIRDDGSLELSRAVNVTATSAEVESTHLEYGDFLFNTRNSRELVGKTALFLGSGLYLFNNNILRIRFHDDVDPFYFAMAFRTPYVQQQLESRKSGTTSVFAVYQKNLFTIDVPVPPKALQSAFRGIAQQVNHLRERLSEARETCDQSFSSLLHRAFTGGL